jgi:protein TonB
MFETLLASHAAPIAWHRPALAAGVMHFVIVVAAVAGRPASTERPDQPRDTIRLELGRPQAAVPRRLPQPPRLPQNRLVPSAPSVPRMQLESPLDPSLLSQPSPPPSSLSSLAEGPAPSAIGVGQTDSVWSSVDVDRLPEPAGEIRPHYPKTLASSGLSGVVELEYVIGSNGRVEAGTIQVGSSSHPAFAFEAKAALLGARFRPALRSGRPVPVRVRQTIRFLAR